MTDVARLLGFAFANADLLFEIDGEGKIVFAAGATRDFVHDANAKLVGQSASRLFRPTENLKFAALTRTLGAGTRAGPYRFELANESEAQLSLFRLPENNGHISCTLAKLGAGLRPGGLDTQTGLADREGFLAEAAGIAGDGDELALVTVPGLRDVSSKLPPKEAEKLLRHIGDTIREAGPKAAGRLSDISFGIIARTADGQNKIGQSIRAALKGGGIDTADIEEALVSLKTGALSDDQRMLALRYVVGNFSAHGKSANLPLDLSGAFSRLMDDTQNRLLALTKTVADGSFTLAYQPIVDLKTGVVSHYEALARFAQKENTGEIIGFAEALGIADAFDLAVAVKVLSGIGAPDSGAARVAFNLSGNTLSSPAAFGLLAGVLARNRALAPRILIEITETAEIVDIASANKAIQIMRDMGYRVGLDDFGAGAASMQYLHGFTVDFVKIDGALVKKLGKSDRDDKLLRGIVKLCSELGVESIAECIEDERLFAKARAAGFDLGQGHHFGSAQPGLPSAKFTPAATRARRLGVRESWG